MKHLATQLFQSIEIMLKRMYVVLVFHRRPFIFTKIQGNVFL